jgi:hypothetical protein
MYHRLEANQSIFFLAICRIFSFSGSHRIPFNALQRSQKEKEILKKENVKSFHVKVP